MNFKKELHEDSSNSRKKYNIIRVWKEQNVPFLSFFFNFKQLGNLSFRWGFFCESFVSPRPLGVLMKTSNSMTSLLMRHWLSVHVLNTAYAFIYLFLYLNQASNENNTLWIKLSIYDGICLHL